MFAILNIKGREYRCRLTTKSCVELERRIGTNPLNLFAKLDEGIMPKLECLIAILFYSLKDYEHSIKLEDVYSIYDDYLEEGHSIMDFIEFLAEILEVSGFLPSEKN